nr:MAG TPA: hypothetical protein [Caudoviricetes sp.]
MLLSCGGVIVMIAPPFFYCQIARVINKFIIFAVLITLF